MISILEIKDLLKYFGKTKAVDVISFSLGEGTVIALLIPNSAVKPLKPLL